MDILYFCDQAGKYVYNTTAYIVNSTIGYVYSVRRIKTYKRHINNEFTDMIHRIAEEEHKKCYYGKIQKCVRGDNNCPFKDPNNYDVSYYSIF